MRSHKNRASTRHSIFYERLFPSFSFKICQNVEFIGFGNESWDKGKYKISENFVCLVL